MCPLMVGKHVALTARRDDNYNNCTFRWWERPMKMLTQENMKYFPLISFLYTIETRLTLKGAQKRRAFLWAFSLSISWRASWMSFSRLQTARLWERIENKSASSRHWARNKKEMRDLCLKQCANLQNKPQLELSLHRRCHDFKSRFIHCPACRVNALSLCASCVW